MKPTQQSPWPFVGGRGVTVVSASGCHLMTADGRRILDAAGGAIVANVGHAHPQVAATIDREARRLSYVVPPWRTPSRDRLVERLRNDWLPPRLTRVHMTSGGSEANESAIKIALQYHYARGETQRSKIVSRDISYHGTTLAMAAISGHPARKRGLTACLAENPKCATPYPLRAPARVAAADLGRHYVNDMRRVIEREGPETIAAVLIEPVTGSSGGAIVPPDDYLPGVRALCDEYGVLLIADEVMTGFGRTGARFAVDHYGVCPDLLVAGKGLAGGYMPIAGVFATEAVAEPLVDAGLDVMFHTFGALPLACAAADTVLEILAREQLVERALETGSYLRTCLGERLGQHPHVAEIRGRGLLQAIEVVAERERLERFPESAGITGRIVSAGLERGVFFYPGGTGAVRDIVVMGPPLVIERSDVERMVEVLAAAIDQATRK